MYIFVIVSIHPYFASLCGKGKVCFQNAVSLLAFNKLNVHHCILLWHLTCGSSKRDLDTSMRKDIELREKTVWDQTEFNVRAIGGAVN